MMVSWEKATGLSSLHPLIPFFQNPGEGSVGAITAQERQVTCRSKFLFCFPDKY